MERVVGKVVTVEFDGKRCVHSRNCVLSHPEVFVPNVQGEWIFPDAATPEAVLQIGLNCPSGAIRVRRNDGAASSDAAPVVNLLRLRENGPLALEAPILIGGQQQVASRATLCRCGHSANKPYCDGSHTAAGFVATGEVAAKDSQPLEQRNGPVEVVAQPDGPLKVTGNLEVVSGTGRTLNRATRLFLCRCGHSANKPYCDGSHKAAGFTAPGV
ncbi:CDGSH iron-sulfur domain-containing protein [Fuscibacter oryzae]|uniref:CDGSH iron-sulfur domain-containing protein n=1 Tax=Fuscibacter oryzae TaxID=2803939 RepID=A0A8J7MQR2_9RHOB|nr:CDGSH iron-sulfur domain-containing protein [Fuscibacter oryzae]MBL4927847.1 CDGSH iron-sulfur domain-containing protein [Fuscibacter oryzae]